MSSDKLGPGDLVTIEPWDCEGVEPPWGWHHGSPPPRARSSRVHVHPGTVGMIIDRHEVTEDPDNAHYVVIVGDRKLTMPLRFLHRVEHW